MKVCIMLSAPAVFTSIIYSTPLTNRSYKRTSHFVTVRKPNEITAHNKYLLLALARFAPEC